MTEEPEPTFEAALGQLERIVADLERGGPDLTAALGRYESGIKLLKRCHVLLDRAEQAVALLTGVDAEGNPITAPFDATATVAREPAATTISTSSPLVAAATEPAVNVENAAPSDPAPRTPARKTTRRPKEPESQPEPQIDPDPFDPPF
jgi:exodeoxyribonuclease VII small subunit